ncbi:hypothetical protein [Pedobacter metabolipauper]|uniref:Adhesin n=1 Tax=Pedobacter metabolipauper TaxID=425513 RepID=A0A4R6SY87_9SPHI|nr:hypothetical protein [Pedobacter metabolipauper]TDQ09644.1 hypothetical protein ATK78_1800 [Pedobacter metabolipauper]
MKKLTVGMAGLVFIVNLAYAQTPGPVQEPRETRVRVENRVSVVVNDTDVRVKSTIQDDGPMRNKSVSKSFSAGNSDKLVLSNSFGSIQIKVWDKREIKVDIDIKAYANSDSEAQELIDAVSIESGKTGDEIAFRTKLDRENKNWGNGTRNGKKWRREVKINYVVYMPASNSLTLSQIYGSGVTIGDFSGPLYAKVQFADFTAQNLKNSNNYISVQYGKTNIQSVNVAKIRQQYGSGLVIGTVNTLDLDAQYSSVNVTTVNGNALIKQQYGGGLALGSVDNLDLNIQYASAKINTIKGNAKVDQQYNSITIGSVGKLDLSTQYTTVNVGVLRGDGKFNMEYNKLIIGEITKGCKVLNIDGEYVGISTGFSEGYDADFDVQTNYASFKYGSGVAARQINNDDKEYSSKKYYIGKIGSGSSATVKIKSEYGSVTFK